MLLAYGLAGGPLEATPPNDVLRAASSRLEAGDLAGAIGLLESAVDRPEGSVASLLGSLYLRSGRFREALDTLTPFADAKDAGAVLLFRAAHACFEVGDDERGEAYLERAARLAPQSLAAVELSRRRYLQGRYDEARALLALVAEAASSSDFANQSPKRAADVFLLYARILTATRRGEDAAEQLGRATELLPENPAVWQALGEALIELGRIEEARRAMAMADRLVEARRLDEGERWQEAERLFAESRHLRQEGQPVEALALLRQAIEKAPRDTRLRGIEVQALEELGRMEEALKRAEELVDVSPGNATALAFRGRLRQATGDDRGAEADFRRVLETRADDPDALTGLAELLLERNPESGEARQLLELLARSDH